MTVSAEDRMAMSGFCATPSTTGNSHQFCKKPGCPCPCHEENDRG